MSSSDENGLGGGNNAFSNSNINVADTFEEVEHVSRRYPQCNEYGLEANMIHPQQNHTSSNPYPLFQGNQNLSQDNFVCGYETASYPAQNVTQSMNESYEDREVLTSDTTKSYEEDSFDSSQSPFDDANSDQYRSDNDPFLCHIYQNLDENDYQQSGLTEDQQNLYPNDITEETSDAPLDMNIQQILVTPQYTDYPPLIQNDSNDVDIVVGINELPIDPSYGPQNKIEQNQSFDELDRQVPIFDVLMPYEYDTLDELMYGDEYDDIYLTEEQFVEILQQDPYPNNLHQIGIELDYEAESEQQYFYSAASAPEDNVEGVGEDLNDQSLVMQNEHHNHPIINPPSSQNDQPLQSNASNESIATSPEMQSSKRRGRKPTYCTEEERKEAHRKASQKYNKKNKFEVRKAEFVTKITTLEAENQNLHERLNILKNQYHILLNKNLLSEDERERAETEYSRLK
uniref:BZIP domain-containing protein n=1 Tax=Panagrolaimus sp. ES5 TaxID=591445 RepID=A0AC34GXZ2_9BILA